MKIEKNSDRRSTLPKDLQKEYKKYEERQKKFKDATEKMRENAENEWKSKRLEDKKKVTNSLPKTDLLSLHERIQRNNNGENFKIDHEKAKKNVEISKEKQTYVKLKEYLKENNIAEQSLLGIKEENDIISIIYKDENGNTSKKVLSRKELIKQSEDKNI